MIRRLLAFLAALALAVPALAQPQITPSDRVKRNVVVRPSPAATTVAGRLRPGEVAELLSEVPGWYQVRLSDGTVGFVSKTWTIVRDDGQPQPLVGGLLKVHVIDVGTGLATFVEGPGFTMLYDAGSQDDLAMGAENRVLAYIKAVRPDVTTIDHLVLSHPHKDHLELMPDIFEAMTVRNVWDSGAINRTRGYCRFLTAVSREPGVQYHNAVATGGTHSVTFTGNSCSGTIAVPQAAMMSDQPVRLGPATTMTIVYGSAERRPNPNANTVVVRIDHGSNHVLFAGDAEGGGRVAPSNPPTVTSIEGKLVDCCRTALKADVLVVGHHGSLTSSRRAFLNAVGASVFVISSGPHAYSKKVLPDPEVVAELKSRGTVFQTDIDDEACQGNDSKIGPDSDESPGGCDNVVVTVPTAGQITAAYNRTAD